MVNQQISDLQPGKTYYVQVRAINASDNNLKSEWSKSFKFTTTNDVIAPKPVSNLSFVSEGTSFIAKWDAPTQSADNSSLTDLKGYFIKFINAEDTLEFSGEIFTAEKSFVLDFDRNAEIFGMARGHLTVSIRAVDMVGNLSTALTATAQNPIPADITGLSSTDLIEAIQVDWEANEENDIHHYELFVSTVSSGFTPGPLTRRYAGPNTSFLVTSGNPVPHYIKVVAVDVFGQQSVNPQLTTNTPRTTTSTDGTPPDDPTTFVLSSSADEVSASITATWVAPSAVDVDHYVIRYATDTSNWAYISAPPDVTQAVIRNLKADGDYYVGIKAVDFSANSSSWVNASVYPYTTAADTIAPNKPSPPSIATSVLKAQISHDMKDTFAVDLAGDTEYIEVYADTTSGFTPVPGNQVTKIKTAGQGVGLSTMVTYPTSTNLYWKVIAVDTSGNRSAASDATLGTPNLIEGAYIGTATITDAHIGSLSAAKLVAGTAFVNDLFIRSELVIDDVDGLIKSDDYDAMSQSGWKIDRNGIIIYDGSIQASALLIQDSQNIIPPQFADFEFNNEFYYDSNNLPNTLNLTTSAPSARLIKVLTGNKYGTQNLRFYDTTGASNNWLNLTPSGIYNVPIDGGNTYIFSFWVKNALGSAKNIDFALITDSAETFSNSVSIPATSSWTRVSVLCATTVSATKAYVRIGSVANTPIDFNLDGLQIERKISAATNPSPWTPSGNTTISGESIVTGSIRSSAPAASVVGQPAWSLNTAGNAQFGDALVRGSLTVGAGADLSNSVVKSSNYAAGSAGWVIKGDGSVEFNSGTFRGDLNIERVTMGLTTRLQASTAQQKIYTAANGSDIAGGSVVALNTPAILGQHYGYAKAYDAGSGRYLPTNPDANNKFRYFFGPTTERSLVMQTNTNDADYIIVGFPATYPWNTQVTSFKLGEIMNYDIPAMPREQSGWMVESSNIERNGVGGGKIPYTYTKTSLGGTITPELGAQNLITHAAATTPRSPNAPEYTLLSDGTADPLEKPLSNQSIITRAASSTIPKNLIKDPYDETFNLTLTFDNTETLNDLVGSGAGQVQVSNTNDIKVTASVQPGMYDSNYKTPSYLVNFSAGTTAASSILYFTNKRSTNALPANTNYNVTSIRRGKTYIISMYLKTDIAGSQTSGTQGPPAADFTMYIGLEVQNGNSSQSTYIATANATASTVTSAPVTVKAGVATQRVSVAITIPNTPATETENANLYVGFPAYTPRNRRIAITHPMVEEKVWGSHPNPVVAASNLPTAWSSYRWYVTSTSTVSLVAIAEANTDLRYDAFGRNARGNQLYSDLNQYQASDYKLYRSSPAYFDVQIDRRAEATNITGVEYGQNVSIKYRFGEAGLQFPSSHEPYMPAGIQEFYNSQTIAAGGGTGDKNINLSDRSLLVSGLTTQLGEDIRAFNTSTSYVVDRAGFYIMTLACVIETAGSDPMWFEWKVSNSTGIYTLNKTATGRSNVWEQTSSLVRYLNRDDILTPFLWNASTGTSSHLVRDVMIVIARIN